MILWCISNHHTLSAEGGLRASGRWHTRGQRVVYCAPTPAAALLEILVHLEVEVDDLPTRYRLLKIDVPDDAEVEQLEPATLPGEWIDDLAATRFIGDVWLRELTTPLIQVPSAIVPDTFNFLLNPDHPAAGRIAVVHVTDHTIDPRLLGR